MLVTLGYEEPLKSPERNTIRKEIRARLKRNRVAVRVFRQSQLEGEERQRHLAAQALANARYNAKNRQARNRDNVVRQLKRRKEDAAFRLQHLQRHRLYNLVRRVGARAVTRSRLCGCSGDELRKHIEGLFLPGMTWENYGLNGWHIDHKRPCASFDLTKEEEVLACFHYTNLQPLWALDNIRKGATWAV